jgi:molybdenum cofactor cytidylyltransferase
MGRRNKLLAEIDGVPMVSRVVDAALASAAESVLVVTGHEPERVAETLGARAVRTVHNPDFEQGLSTSLKVGLAALPAETDGAVVLLGDMPRVTAEHIDRLLAAFDPLEGRAICVPTYDGKRGNPVLFSAEFFAEMRGVAGDVGARHLIGQHEDQVAEVAMEDDAIFLDIDTPEALTAIGGDAA